MNRQEIKDRLLDMLQETLEKDVSDLSITDETRLAEDLQVTSLEVTELVFEIEEAFDVRIPDDALTSLKTVGDVISHIERKP